ncbi:MAG TPA: uroporphyrinogen decarboxylase family protein [Verrucomicrobiota bacterium]|nr:uroporphyrinogen decarboxylase family protein [Verrucomicrobiota bacterium]
MNGRDRVAAAMRHQPVDRVPVFCQLALGHYFLHSGLAPRDIWFTSEGFAEALVRLQQRYDFDGILVNLPGRPPDLWTRLRRIEPGEAGDRLVWDDGSITVMPPDDNPRHLGPGGDPLPRADVAAIDPDHLETLDDLTGYVWNTYHIPWLPGKGDRGPLADVPAYFFETLDRVREKTRHAVSVHGEVFSPFTQYQELLGYEAALLSLATDPGKADALLERLTDAAVAWGVAQARHGADAVLVSSAFAGAGFISRRMYERFVLPHERRLINAIRQTGVPAYTHTCGRIGDRLDLMEATGTQGIDTLDPPPLGNVTLGDAKQRVGSRLFLKGNLNAVALLECERPEEVDAAVGACLRDGAPGGGYILSTACSVAPRVAPWKLERFAPLARGATRL